MSIQHVALPAQLRGTLLRLGAATELTVAAGAVTVTRSRHTVDTEGDAATDDLGTISGGLEGDLLQLLAENAARIVTLKHGTGNIRTHDGQDVDLSTAGHVELVLAASGNWLVQKDRT